MKKILLLVVVSIMTAMSAQAQIPAEVTEIMKKCDEKFKNDNVFVFDPKKYPNAVVVRK